MNEILALKFIYDMDPNRQGLEESRAHLLLAMEKNAKANEARVRNNMNDFKFSIE